jgi:F-type H+-transporting ATPase subunit epsilon
LTAFAFELVTPERVLWSGQAAAVSMRTDVGEVTFLANHSPLVGALDITVLRIEPAADGGDEDDAPAGSAEEVRAAVHGGFVLVDANKVVLASGVAEMADEIDVPRAKRALESATSKVEAESAEAPAAPAEEDGGPASGPGVASAAFLDPRSAEAALRRAKVRLAAVSGDTEQVA